MQGSLVVVEEVECVGVVGNRSILLIERGSELNDFVVVMLYSGRREGAHHRAGHDGGRRRETAMTCEGWKVEGGEVAKTVLYVMDAVLCFPANLPLFVPWP